MKDGHQRLKQGLRGKGCHLGDTPYEMGLGRECNRLDNDNRVWPLVCAQFEYLGYDDSVREQTVIHWLTYYYYCTVINDVLIFIVI